MELITGKTQCTLFTVLLLSISICHAEYYGQLMMSMSTILHERLKLSNTHIDALWNLNTLLRANPGFSRSSYKQIMTDLIDLTAGTDSKCSSHINATLTGLFNREMWAIKMLDATGKPPSGVLNGNIFLLGDYDECVNITASVNVIDHWETLKGQYCKAGIKIISTQGSPVAFGPEGIPVGDLTLGLCVPDACSASDLKNIIDSAMKVVLKNSSLSVDAVICQPKSMPFEPQAIGVILLLSALGIIITLATAYDILLIRNMTPSIKEAESKIEEHKPLITENGDQPEAGSSLNIKHRGYGSQNATEQEVQKANIQEPIPIGIGRCGQLLLAFSLYTNSAKILSTEGQRGTIGALNGIRFISMTWVILGHSYAFGFSLADNVQSFFTEALNSVSFMALINATLSVDTFFVLSGLLVSLLSLRQLHRAGSVKKINWPMYYIHRLWRLTPPYMLTLMFYVVLFQYWYDGPFWPQKGIEVNYCKDTWWKNFLYINNFFKAQNTCMVWSWYLANDMQFYIISPLLVIPLYISGVFGVAVCLLLLVSSFIVSGVLSSVNDYPIGLLSSDISKTGAYFDNIYVRPYTRIGPYIIGMLTGYLMHMTSCKVKMSKLVVVLGWLVAAVCCLSVVYGPHEHISGKHFDSKEVVALYTALHRSVWALGVCWVIFACATGYGGFVNTFLSWDAFAPLSRLTYLAYLIHPVTIQFRYFAMRQPLYINNLELAFLYLGNVVIAYVAAFVLSLVFESPFMGIERALRKKSS